MFNSFEGILGFWHNLRPLLFKLFSIESDNYFLLKTIILLNMYQN